MDHEIDNSNELPKNYSLKGTKDDFLKPVDIYTDKPNMRTNRELIRKYSGDVLEPLDKYINNSNDKDNEINYEDFTLSQTQGESGLKKLYLIDK